MVKALRNFKVILRQKIKTILHKCFLPMVYNFYRFRRLEPRKVIFADSNTETLPDSMREVYEKLRQEGYDIRLHFCNFQTCGLTGMLSYLYKFMKDYATAGCVFICNYFVPVTSCRKREETEVVQLWHSCGLLKKFAYDTEEDISPHYHGNVTKNISLITVSAPACVPVFQDALHLKGKDRGIVQALGVSRTDVFFRDSYNRRCKEVFWEKYPQWRNKKIVVWAPTFRGTAADPRIVGEQEILRLGNKLGEEWAVVIKLHPKLKENFSNCDLPTAQLFACTDVLISDYSSLIFEYGFYRKPIVLYVPDLEEYEEKRGFYIDMKEIPGSIVTDGKELAQAVLEEHERAQKRTEEENRIWDHFIERHCGACDGHATDRILTHVFSE